MPFNPFKLSCYALVRNAEGAYLLLQRPKDKPHFPGQWELPGGKMDPGETIEQAVCREVWEEAGLKIVPEALAGAVDFPIKYFRAIMLVLEAGCESDQVRLSKEHQTYRWVCPDEVLKMPLTEQLKRFFEHYLSTRKARGKG
jgi:8-oxo-dGTP diphosphatase